MEISFHLNPRIGKKLPIFSKRRTLLQKLCKSKSDIISCRGNRLTMQRGSKNFYEVLSLGSENVGFDEIKKAYRSMALQYHPDVCSPSRKEESTTRFVELRRAYETLSDPVSRKKYDYELGLGDSMVLDVGRMRRVDGVRSNFPKEVWENQLCGLKRRSCDRMKRKKMGHM